jgi:hypothetical protein
MFYGVDRFTEKYPNMTPYQFSGLNPLGNIDVNGDSLQAVQTEAQQMIKNTLTKEDASYLQFNKEGTVNMDLLNSHDSESGNFNNIKEIANSDLWMDVKVDDEYQAKDNQGNLKDPYKMSYQEADPFFADPTGETLNGTTTGEAGYMGKTLLPGIGTSGENSPDNKIHIIINKHMSEAARAEMYSHEANGHGLMFMRSRNREQSGHIYKGSTDINQPLRQLIIKSKMETVKNMKNR